MHLWSVIKVRLRKRSGGSCFKSILAHVNSTQMRVYADIFILLIMGYSNKHGELRRQLALQSCKSGSSRIRVFGSIRVWFLRTARILTRYL